MTQSVISGASFAAVGLNLFLCIGLPLLLIAILLIKRRATIRPVLVGMGVFVVFQMVLRISIVLPLLSAQPLFQSLMGSPWFSGLFLGLTAGLFEEFGRVIGFKSLLTRQRSWWDGVAFGLGHGGIEAILISGMTSLNNLVLMIAINNGSYEQMIGAATEGTGVSAEMVQTVYNQLVMAAPLDFLWSGIERVFALTIQVALTLLVLYALRRGKMVYVALAILLHTVVDAPLGILPVYGWNVYMLEGYVGFCALVSAVYIVFSHRQFAALPAWVAPAVPIPSASAPTGGIYPEEPDRSDELQDADADTFPGESDESESRE